MLALADALEKCFGTKKVHVKMRRQRLFNNFIVWFDGPVQDALLCLMDRGRMLRFD